jgi:hypothetical protein
MCRYNPLGPDGVKAVVATVKYELPLAQLRIEWCQAGDRAGAEHIAQLLQFNESLEVLLAIFRCCWQRA